jgi:hypothetical protein
MQAMYLMWSIESEECRLARATEGFFRRCACLVSTSRIWAPIFGWFPATPIHIPITRGTSGGSIFFP